MARKLRKRSVEVQFRNRLNSDQFDFEMSAAYLFGMKARWGGLVFVGLIFVTVGFGCGKASAPSPGRSGMATSEMAAASEEIVTAVRAATAKVLEKKESEIDVKLPLVLLGADELDVVAIVMEVEERFGIEIPDEVIGENVSEVSKTLSVERLARAVAEVKSKN